MGQHGRVFPVLNPNTSGRIDSVIPRRHKWAIGEKDIRSNLNLITDKGNIYSFTLEDITDQQAIPT
jgi:hypothetical protein